MHFADYDFSPVSETLLFRLYGDCQLNRSTQHFVLDGKMECIQ
jgi:hypothetical protein